MAKTDQHNLAKDIAKDIRKELQKIYPDQLIATEWREVSLHRKKLTATG
jgi:hypothetical protein